MVSKINSKFSKKFRNNSQMNLFNYRNKSQISHNLIGKTMMRMMMKMNRSLILISTIILSISNNCTNKLKMTSNLNNNNNYNKNNKNYKKTSNFKVRKIIYLKNL